MYIIHHFSSQSAQSARSRLEHSIESAPTYTCHTLALLQNSLLIFEPFSKLTKFPLLFHGYDLIALFAYLDLNLFNQQDFYPTTLFET